MGWVHIFVNYAHFYVNAIMLTVATVKDILSTLSSENQICGGTDAFDPYILLVRIDEPVSEGG